MNHSMSSLACRCAALAATATLAACGGTEGSDGPSVAYYQTVFYREGQLLALMELEGTEVYGFYQSRMLAPGFFYGGFFVARRDAAEGSDRATYRGVDFDFERKAALPVELTLEHTTGGGPQPTVQGLVGRIERQGADADQFDAAYAEVAREPTRATLPGSYAGTMRSLTVEGTVQASLDADGRLSVGTPGGCTLTGTLTARPLGNLYRVEATFGPSCPTLAGRYTGYAIQSFLTNNVYLMLTSGSLEKGVFVHLFEPRE